MTTEPDFKLIAIVRAKDPCEINAVDKAINNWHREKPTERRAQFSPFRDSYFISTRQPQMPRAPQTANEFRAKDPVHRPPVFDFATEARRIDAESQKWIAFICAGIFCTAATIFYAGYLTYEALNPLGDF